MTGSTITLSTALSIFSDHLTDIKDSLAVNMLHDITSLPPLPVNQNWVHEALRELELEEITLKRSKVINRIVARQRELTDVQKLTQITDEMIEIAREVPIEDIFEGQLISSGRNYTALCPFHPERTQSFHVRTSTNRFKCFGCNISGDSIDYYMRTHSVSFHKAVRMLSTLPTIPHR